MFYLYDYFDANNEQKHYKCTSYSVQILYKNNLIYSSYYNQINSTVRSTLFHSKDDIIYYLDKYCDTILSSKIENQNIFNFFGLNFNDEDVHDTLISQNNYCYDDFDYYK